MAIIIETCPKCGHDLVDEVICTYPPIPKKSCWSCGWSWTGEPEKVVRVPFGGNSLIVDDLVGLENCNALNIKECSISENNAIRAEDLKETHAIRVSCIDLKQGF